MSNEKALERLHKEKNYYETELEKFDKQYDLKVLEKADIYELNHLKEMKKETLFVLEKVKKAILDFSKSL